MNYFLKQIYVGVLLSAINHDAVSQVQSAPRSPEGNAIPVTADNFNRAESDMYWGTIVKDDGRYQYYSLRYIVPKRKKDGDLQAEWRSVLVTGPNK